MGAGHQAQGAAFVDEHQLQGPRSGRASNRAGRGFSHPSAPARRHAQSFLPRELVVLEDAADPPRPRALADGLCQALRDLCQGQVRLLGDPAEDQAPVPTDAVRSAALASPVRLRMPACAGPADPPEGRGYTDAEPRCRPSAGELGLESIRNTPARIDGKGCGHAGWPHRPSAGTVPGTARPPDAHATRSALERRLRSRGDPGHWHRPRSGEWPRILGSAG